MRRIVILLGVSALVASATGPAAYGQVWAYFNSDLWNACNSFPWIPHDSDPLDSNSMVPYFENPSTGPFVTEDGLVFLKNPAALEQRKSIRAIRSERGGLVDAHDGIR